MNETAEEKAERLSQWFTPEPLARKVAAWAQLEGLRVIEPAAGPGALVAAAIAERAAHVACIDIDPIYAAALERRFALERREPPTRGERIARTTITVGCADFLELRLGQLRTADLGLHNPPYENGLDGRFSGRMMMFAPRAVAILRQSALVGLAHYVDVWRRVRVTRLAYLVKRPPFEGVLARRGPRSDFAVVEYVDPRSTWMAGQQTIEHWPESWA